MSGTSTGNTPGAVNFSINQAAAAALTPQAYYGTIRVTATGAVNSPQDFQVVLNVTAANAPQTPNPTPAGLIFITSGTTPAPQIDQVFASSVTAVPYQASAQTVSGGAWLSVSPATGMTSASSPAQTSVSVNPAGLAAGVYHGTVSYSLAAAAVPTVNVTLVVETSGQSAAGRTGFGPEASTACTPTQIIPTQTALVNDFAAPASWPTPLQIQLNDNCGNAVGNGQVVTTFSNGDPPLALNLANAASGLYSGTWTPRATGSQVVVTATATAPGFTAAATTQISGAVAPNVAPVLNQNGTLDAFAIAAEPGVPIAPGSIVAIYGTGLAAQAIPNTMNSCADQLGRHFGDHRRHPGSALLRKRRAGECASSLRADGGAALPGDCERQRGADDAANYSIGRRLPGHCGVSVGIRASRAQYRRESDHGRFAGQAGRIRDHLSAGDGADDGACGFGGRFTVPAISVHQRRADGHAEWRGGFQHPFSGLTPTVVGLYQIDFQVPADAANGDLTLVVSQTGFTEPPVILPVHN